MEKEQRLVAALVSCVMAGMLPQAAYAAEAETVETAETAQAEEASQAGDQKADTEPVVVKAARSPIPNPYTTGGDVDVITRRDIEKHNYSSVQEAISRIPGVRIATPGYRGGEYGYELYNTEFTINGESSIVVVVDGSRVDNDAYGFAGNKSRVNLQTLPGIDDIEQIEVIKGSGAAIYGADASGGVLSITTRRGTKEPRTTLNLGTGSWHHHRYALTHTGSADDGTLRYAVSLSRERSGDTEYRDAFVSGDKRYRNTNYREDHAAVNITKDFGEKHSLSLNYYHAYDKDHYPIAAPDYRYLDSFYNGTMADINPETHRYQGLSSARTKGYRNIFLYDALLNSHDEQMTNNVSMKYVFDRMDEGAESYVRLFRNHTRYDMSDFSSIWNVPYTYLDEFWAGARDSSNNHTDIESTAGMALQLAKRYGRHSVTGGVDWRHSAYTMDDGSGSYKTKRNMFDLYLQDKMKLSDKFALTPGLVYTHYGSGDYDGVHFGDSKRLTFSLYGSYDFDKYSNAYFSASQIFKPVTGMDRSREYKNDVLDDEKGWSLTAGVSRRFTPRDAVKLNVGFTDMDNAIGRYNVYDESSGKWLRRSVNAKRMKRSMNLSYVHSFTPAWKLEASYSWVNEDFRTKHVTRNPDGTNTDDLVNALRPRNVYRISLSYDKDRWFGDLMYTLYAGNDCRYFSSSQFHILDLSLNYRLAKDWQIYFNAYNLLNEAYETKASASYGPGALPEPGRSYWIGMKYTF